MNNISPTDSAYVTKRLTKAQRLRRASLPAFGALWFGVPTIWASIIGHEYSVVGLGFIAAAALLAFVAWKVWKVRELTELATVRVPPSATKRGAVYAAFAAVLIIEAAIFARISDPDLYPLFWTQAIFLAVFTAFAAARILVPAGTLTPAAIKEKARLDKQHAATPSWSCESMNGEGDSNVEAEKIVTLRERSTRSVWKEILITAVSCTGVAVGLSIWIAQKNWIWHSGKLIDFHAFPFLASSVVLGGIWTIRGTLGFFRSNNVTPMDRDDYRQLRDLYGWACGESDFPSARLALPLPLRKCWTSRSTPGIVWYGNTKPDQAHIVATGLD